MKLKDLRERFRPKPEASGSVPVGGGRRVAFEATPRSELLLERHWSMLKIIHDATRRQGGLLARELADADANDANVMVRAGFVKVVEHMDYMSGEEKRGTFSRNDGSLYICEASGDKALRARKYLGPNDPDLNDQIHAAQTMAGDTRDFDTDDPFNDHW